MRKNPRREGPALIVAAGDRGGFGLPSDALAESNFRHVWATIRALSDMDPRFDNIIRRIDRISVDVGEGTAHSLSLTGAISGLRAGNGLGSSTTHSRDGGGSVLPDLGLNRLAGSEFYLEHGHINVPPNLVIGGWGAFNWLSKLRAKYVAGELAADLVEKAEALKIRWNDERRHVTIDEGLDRLERSDFYREHGHINAPKGLVIEGWKCGAWLLALRSRFAASRRPRRLSVPKCLESIGIQGRPKRMIALIVWNGRISIVNMGISTYLVRQ